MRIVPQNIDAEESVLGAILLDPEAIGRVIDRLEVRAFSLLAHQKIYQTTVILHQQNKPTDLMTVTTWLLDHNLLDEIGGQFKLAQLVERTVSAVNIELYAGYVTDKYIRRELIHAGHEIAELGYDTTRELPIILDEAEQKVFKLNQSQAKSGLVHISQTLISAFKELEMRSENDFLPGLSSGFYDLDGMTGGFQRSDLIIIAGRPSMGKTSFALNIAENISRKYKLPVAIFSLEMSKEQLTQRLLTSDCHIESKKLKSERLNLNEWDKITESVGKLSDLSVYIDDTP
ncbi:MAG TPA: replicative DNA helicase, partial [Allocoleopsis sp.]